MICVKLGYIFQKQCRDGVTKIDFGSYANNHFVKKKEKEWTLMEKTSDSRCDSNYTNENR